jgi:hypothetical protein
MTGMRFMPKGCDGGRSFKIADANVESAAADPGILRRPLDQRLHADDEPIRAARRNTEMDGWKELGVLAVASDDDRLTWPVRELVRQLGERLYGKRQEEVRHG